MNTYSIHGIGGRGAVLASVLAYSQRLKDIIRGCRLSEVQEGLTLSPKGRPTTGNFPIPSVSPSHPYLRHLAAVCLGGIFKN